MCPLSVPISELPVVPAWGGGCLYCRAVVVCDAVAGSVSVCQCCKAWRLCSGSCLSVSGSLAIHHDPQLGWGPRELLGVIPSGPVWSFISSSSLRCR